MLQFIAKIFLLNSCILMVPAFAQQSPDMPADGPELQARLLSDIRQLTLTGQRAGEGYFSKDGRYLVFQSEREPNNPFFQIYLMDRETGDTRRISPGLGKTTCAWVHPDNQQVLFASTQYDPKALEKQKSEIEFRQSGESRRYSWDYDETYELVVFDLKTQEYRKLTDAVGYDAEGSYSPDGKLICFASNRRAYSDELSAEEKQLFEKDPASAIDLYLMNSDGSHVRRLTNSIGYDGGPFFSPDGKQICWRRFSRDGATAEIMMMNVDGSQERQLTKMDALSWAPFFHPSGEYLIFATNRHGFANFELYMVDARNNVAQNNESQVQSSPQRVTYRDGFDGLPAFSPDGNSLVWTSNAGSSRSQLYEGSWNHAAARQILGLDQVPAADSSQSIAKQAADQSIAQITEADIGRHVDYLCRPELGGRLTGTEGEKLATSYVAAYLEYLGLQPAGKDGTFFHEFEFMSNVELGQANRLAFGDRIYSLEKDWRPLSFSKAGKLEPTELVFAGYGIEAPEIKGGEAYHSYTHLDATDKLVVVFRGMPQDISPERRQQLSAFSHEHAKAIAARDRGAKGIIFVSGPTGQYRSQLIPLRLDGTMGASSLAVFSVSDEVAEGWFKKAGQNMGQLQRELDTGNMMMGMKLDGVRVEVEVELRPVVSRGRNVLALLPAKKDKLEEMVIVGAHIDHLGEGTGSSLARTDEQGAVHRGADDNASGVAVMMEIAEYLASEVRAGQLELERDILFAAWSGEELGLRGSTAFTDDFSKLFPGRLPTEGQATSGSSLYPHIAAYLNLDMVGRLRENLVLQGLGSSPYWSGAIERRNAVVRLSLTLQDECFLPTDATSFFVRGVPILAAFTGAHEEYHTPRDVPELLNYEGASKVARLTALIARDLLLHDAPPEYQAQQQRSESRGSLRAWLGTVPDYGQAVLGVPIARVTKDSPADKAGMKDGDIVVSMAERAIENIYDYTDAIKAVKIGQPIAVRVKRGDQEIELQITPASRD